MGILGQVPCRAGSVLGERVTTEGEGRGAECRELRREADTQSRRLGIHPALSLISHLTPLCQDEPMASTMIFLHGPGQIPPNWQDVIGHISPDRPMVAPWVKGLKPTDKEPFSMEMAAGEIANLMELRGLEHADVIGFSLGGMVGLRAAADYPAMIGRLVLISTPVSPPVATLKAQRRLLKLMPEARFTDVPKSMVLEAFDAYIAADVSADLSRVRAKTLAVHAAGDPVGKASAALLEQEIGAKILALPGNDPDLLARAPEALAKAIEVFCA